MSVSGILETLNRSWRLALMMRLRRFASDDIINYLTPSSEFVTSMRPRRVAMYITCEMAEAGSQIALQWGRSNSLRKLIALLVQHVLSGASLKPRQFAADDGRGHVCRRMIGCCNKATPVERGSSKREFRISITEARHQYPWPAWTRAQRHRRRDGRGQRWISVTSVTVTRWGGAGHCNGVHSRNSIARSGRPIRGEIGL